MSSVGKRAWVYLFVGPGGRDPLVLEAKEAQASVLETYRGADEFDNHRVRSVGIHAGVRLVPGPRSSPLR